MPLATTKTFMPNADWRPQGLASISHKHFANGPGPELAQPRHNSERERKGNHTTRAQGVG